MNFFNRISIKNKIFILTSAQLLIAIILIGSISLGISAKLIKKHTIRQTELSFNHITNNLVDYSDEVYDLSQEILYDSSIFNTVAFNEPINDDISEDIYNLMRKTILSRNIISALAICINDNAFFSTQKSNNIFPYGSVGYLNLEKKLRTMNGSPYWYLSNSNDGITNIFFARMIYNPYTYNEEGLLIFQINKDYIYELVNQFNHLNGQSFAIVSLENRYIVKSDNIESQISTEDLKTISGITEKESISQINNDILMYTNIPQLYWKIISIIDSKIIYKDIYYLTLYVILSCVISLLLVILFSIYMNHSISRPLLYLTNTMADWNENKQFENIQRERTDEIGFLYSSFEHLTQKIYSLINKNYRTEIMLKETEIKMLQSQINPHFLFNTLESINSIAMIHEVPEICNMIGSLSNILNQSIGRTSNMVSLKEELVYIDSYVYILNTRFKNKFSVFKEIAPETENIYIPSLIIQPIVENAINHGIMPSDKNCTICISSFIEDNDLFVSVTDDGVGIEPQKLNELKNSLQANLASSNGSIGLMNVNKRLKLTYGENYELSIDSKVNEYTEITAKFRIINISQDEYSGTEE